MATRIEIRDYYRKTIGFMSLVNSIWLLAIAGLSIFISDAGELSPETNAEISELLLYGFYATFFIGAFVVLLMFIGAIVAMKSNSEGVFKFLTMISVFAALLDIVFILSSVNSLWLSGIDWKDTYTYTVLLVGFVLSIISTAYSVFVIVMAVLGKKYYDGKKLAKEAGEVSLYKLNVKYTGYTMISYMLFALVVYMFSLYFKYEISAFDEYMAADNTKYINLFNRVFIAGIVMSVIQLVMTVMVFVKKTATMLYANKIILMGQTAVMAFYAIITIAIMPKNFTKLMYPDPAYIYFSYIFIIVNLILAIRAWRMKITE